MQKTSLYSAYSGPKPHENPRVDVLRSYHPVRVFLLGNVIGILGGCFKLRCFSEGRSQFSLSKSQSFKASLLLMKKVYNSYCFEMMISEYVSLIALT